MKNLWSLLPLLLLSAGCISVDYVGKKFAPVSVAQVKVYQSAAEVPADKYVVIGRFTASSERRTHPFEVEYEVQTRGAEYGGDAICLVGEYIRPHSEYNSDVEEFGSPDLSQRKIPEKEKELFGSPVPLTSSTRW